MNINNREIERKYLVAGEFISLATSYTDIRQGYLSVTAECTIRIRRRNDRAFLTIKGRPAPGEIGRMEWEREISLEDFDTLFPLCVSGIIEKTRYIVPLNPSEPSEPSVPLLVEVDVFHGENEGLVLAEIELPSEDYRVTLPDFLGREVTADHRYYNSYLSAHPYRQWPEKE